MDSIWCVFSIANEYDQPPNNLEAVFFSKPTFETLRETMGWLRLDQAEAENKSLREQLTLAMAFVPKADTDSSHFFYC